MMRCLRTSLYFHSVEAKYIKQDIAEIKYVNHGRVDLGPEPTIPRIDFVVSSDSNSFAYVEN